MDRQHSKHLLLILLALMLIRGLIYTLILPFDRAPDEKHHFLLIKAKQSQLANFSRAERQQIAAELEVTTYYLLYPETRPDKKTVQDFAGRNLRRPPSSWQIYYLVNAWLLQLCSCDSIRNEIFLIRGISILCGTLTVFFSFLIAKTLFPDNHILAICTPFFIAFIPQFTAMSSMVNNDNFATVLATGFFLVMVKLLKQGLKFIYILLSIVTIGLAILSKRTAIFLLPLFFAFILISFWNTSIGWKTQGQLAGIFFVGLLAGTGGFFLIAPIRNFIETYVIWVDFPEVKRFLLYQAYSLQALKLYVKFFTVFYWSFWGVFGYMSIHLHHFWYVLAALGQLLAICGLCKQVFCTQKVRLHLEPWKAKALYLFAVSFVLTVGIAFFRSVIFRPEDPVLTQGRYLFPVIVPISILTIWGLSLLFPTRQHWRIAIVGMLGLVIMDSVTLSNYLLLSFHFGSIF